MTKLDELTDQAALDKAIADAIAAATTEAVAPYAGFDDLKAKAEQFDAAEQEKLNEADRERQRADAAEARAVAAEQSALRMTVAAAKGIPAQFLAGTTKDELEASADALIEFRGEVVDPNAPRSPLPNPQQANPGHVRVASSAEGNAEADRRFGAK